MLGYNTLVVLAGCALLGLACGTVGAFALLRGRALMADAVGHAALPGVVLAAILVASLGGNPRALPPLLAGAVIAGVPGVRAAMRAEDALWAGGIAAFSVLLCLILFQRLRAACFDPDYARVMGLSVARTDLALLGLIVIVAVAGLQAVGLVLVVALLILPAATARLLTHRLPVLLLVSASLGALAGALGAAASAFEPEWPTGAAVVLAGAIFFTLALLLAPERGLLPEALRRTHRRIAATESHFLRAAWEAQEAAGAGPGTAGDRWTPIAALAAARGWSEAYASRLALWLSLRGLVARAEGEIHLTPRGAAAARRAVRAHRAVELHLLGLGATDIAGADRLADLVEHGLPAEMATRLLAEPSALPQSPHALGPGAFSSQADTLGDSENATRQNFIVRPLRGREADGH